MMESFRIGGTADSDKSDSKDNKAIMAGSQFKFGCNLCGKNKHKAKDCPQCDKIKCKHCGQTGHTKTTCWKLEANRSKRPKWWTGTAAARADNSEMLI
jgi:hypothetical protein